MLFRSLSILLAAASNLHMSLCYFRTLASAWGSHSGRRDWQCLLEGTLVIWLLFSWPSQGYEVSWDPAFSVKVALSWPTLNSYHSSFWVKWGKGRGIWHLVYLLGWRLGPRQLWRRVLPSGSKAVSGTASERAWDSHSLSALYSVCLKLINTWRNGPFY